MLAQASDAYELVNTTHALSRLYGVLGVVGGALWVAMLVYCLWKDHEERHIWVFVLLFLNILGALVYLVVRVLPRVGAYDWLGARGRRKREILRVEADLVHLGDKPHLLHRLGKLLFESGRLPEAEARLRASLALADDRDVCFDLARVVFEQGALEDSSALLTRIVAEEPNHAYGDAVRLHARTLFELGKDAEARPVYEEIVRTRPSAEARFHLAALLERAGDLGGARAQCDLCEREAHATPAFAQGRARRWVKKARALRRRLG